MITLGAETHQGKELTGRRMYEMAETYSGDLGAFARFPFWAWFRYVKDLPYRSDDDLFPDSPAQIVEVVARPRYLLSARIFPALDCKKKSVLLGAWASANRRPFRFLAVSELPTRRIHHVFADIDFGRGFEACDATFPENEIGQSFPLTYAEELRR